MASRLDPVCGGGGMFFNRKILNAIVRVLCLALVPFNVAVAFEYPPLKRGVNVWGILTMPSSASYSGNPGRGPYGQYRSGASPKDFLAIKKQGFDFIRLPVDPTPYFGVSPDRRASLLGQIETIVSSAVSVGLRVIVDVHPPVSGPEYSSEKILNSYFSLFDKKVYVSYKDFLLNLVRQIRSIDGGNVLIEPLNEPWVGCNFSSVVRYGDFFNEIGGEIRKIAPSVGIVYGGPCNSSWKTLVMVNPSSIKVTGVVYTFHFYEPFLFTHQGASWSTAKKHLRYLKGVPFPYDDARALDAQKLAEASVSESDLSSDEKRQIVDTLSAVFRDLKRDSPSDAVLRAFGAIENWRKVNGVPVGAVYLGEFGTLRPRDKSGPDEVSRGAWYKAVRLAAESSGIGWAVWEYADAMGIVNADADREIIPSINSALGLDK